MPRAHLVPSLSLALITAALSGPSCTDSDSVTTGDTTGAETSSTGAATVGWTAASSHATNASTSSGGEAPVCASSDFEAQVIAFCKAQNPPAPQPGELGALCAGDEQCDSGVCLEPFGQIAYCSLKCPEGDECPLAFHCSDTGTSLGAACYREVCIYGGADASSCTANMLAELDQACTSTCKASTIETWINCLAGAGRLCSSADADDHCGVERGLLEACCPGCDPFAW